MKLKFQCPKIKFHWSQLHLSAYILPMAAKIFSLGLMLKVCQTLLKRILTSARFSL